MNTMRMNLRSDSPVGEPAVTGGDRHGYDEIGQRMLLTQPPVRRITVEVFLKNRTGTWTEESVGEATVRDITVESGARMGYLFAPLAEEERRTIESAERVRTCIFMHDVVVERGERFERRARRPQTGKDSQDGDSDTPVDVNILFTSPISG